MSHISLKDVENTTISQIFEEFSDFLFERTIFSSVLEFASKNESFSKSLVSKLCETLKIIGVNPQEWGPSNYVPGTNCLSKFLKSKNASVSALRANWVFEQLKHSKDSRLIEWVITQTEVALHPDPEAGPFFVMGQRHTSFDWSPHYGWCTGVSKQTIIVPQKSDIQDSICVSNAISDASTGMIAKILERASFVLERADAEFLDWLFGERSTSFCSFNEDSDHSQVINILNDNGIIYSESSLSDGKQIIAIQPFAEGSILGLEGHIVSV